MCRVRHGTDAQPGSPLAVPQAVAIRVSRVAALAMKRGKSADGP